MMLKNSDGDDDEEANESDDIHTEDESIGVLAAPATRQRSQSRNLIGTHTDSLSMTAKEQKMIAKDMFRQMKELKAQSEAKGYHGYSGYLHRHESNANLNPQAMNEDEEEELETEYEEASVSGARRKHKHVMFDSASSQNEEIGHSNNNTLTETVGLRKKLEMITSSISKIRKRLENNRDDDDSDEDFFQNQLTEIQDHLEDAEQDLDSNIDRKLQKYQEEIKENKQRIKNMKREQKEREKQEALKRQMEQERLIKEQKAQIAELMMSQAQMQQLQLQISSNAAMEKEESARPKHQTSQSAYFSLDYSEIAGGNNASKKEKSRRRNSNPQIVPFNESEEDDDAHNEDADDDADDFETEEDEITVQYLHNNGGVAHSTSSHLAPTTSMPGFVGTHTPPTIIGYNPGGGAASGYIEGQYQYGYNSPYGQVAPFPPQQREQSQRRREQPLISDSSIKLIGGVVIVLAGVWIVSKFLDRSRRDQMPTAIRRPPRILR